ncbi:hypothetical protein TNCV_5079361 [Trichonephila clavipes]|nr:hypothetical protein TNCV_5079361 [Trichonephila clavipes]
MASSVSRSNSSGLLGVGILKFPDVLIPSIQSVGIQRCDSPRYVMSTGGHYALCRCWICDTLWNVSSLVVVVSRTHAVL